MAALTVNKKRRPQTNFSRNRKFKVAATTEIFEGAMVAIDAAGNLVPASGILRFVGIAAHDFDNSAGAITVDRVIAVNIGQIEQVNAGVAPDPEDIGLPAFFTDDNTITITPPIAPALQNAMVGTLYDIISGTTVEIDTSKVGATLP